MKSVSPIRRTNPRVVHTRQADPGCVRGERQLLKPSTRNGKTLYEARYQCYRATSTASRRTESLVVNGLRPKRLRTAALQYRGPRAKQFQTAPLSFSGLAPRHIAVPTLTFRGRR